MSQAELEKLLDGRLKPIPVTGNRDYVLTVAPWVGGADTPEHFCGSDFEVTFVFFNEPGKGLAWVALESLSGDNPEVGPCVLRQLTKQLGRPTDWTPRYSVGHEQRYRFHRLFSRRWTALWIQPHRVTIQYARERPSQGESP